MIKKFINRLLGKGASAGADADAGRARAAAPAILGIPDIPLGQRVEIPAAEHRIDPSLLDVNAVRVVKTLQQAGFEAYIVGGAVRDLLVGMRPKDFDVATDATPEEVKAQFRRAFIIGRRFRLVHVVFGRGREHETIEVSTFRAYLDPAAADVPSVDVKNLSKPERSGSGGGSGRGDSADKKHVVDASGRVLRDNVWGPQVEDAARRDFTINAMYYDPSTQIVVDYHGGLADTRARLLRMIGDPPTRYREDPVRIIRVVRFAAKLGFALEPATFKPIAKAAPLLANVPISRLFDEMVKLMQTGHAIASIEQMRKFGLIGGSLAIFPVLDAALAPATPNPAREKFVRMALEDTDRRVDEGRAVAPSFMLACMLWHDVQARWTALTAEGEAPFPALQLAVDAVFDARIGDISGRGKLAADMREIWLMQPRFQRRTVSSATALLAQARFRAGYDFLRLRADCGDVTVELADWWEDLHLGNDEEREALLLDLRPQPGSKGKRVSTSAPGKTGAEPALMAAEESDEVDVDDDAELSEGADDFGATAGEGAESTPRKRRRRRRKVAAATGGGGAEPAA